MAPTRGVIIGKFMPPHMGHCYLADFAQSFADELWILVCSLPREPIPGTLRHRWMTELFPSARVLHIEEENPQANRNQPGSHMIWADAVRTRVPEPIDYIFASEDYGWNFAKSLGATFIPVDPSRDQFPISGSELREKPFRNWHYIPKAVRPWFVKTVMVECTPDQEQIVATAAMLLQTLYVPSYSNFYRAFSSGRDVGNDLALRAEEAQYHALKAQSRHVLLVPVYPGMAYPAQGDLVIRQWDSAHHIKDIILDHYKDL